MESEYTVANGPEGLREALNALSRGKDHFILYQLNQQQSLIKIDTSESPYQLWYYDLMGRPATNTVKDVVAQFLKEKCGISLSDSSHFVDLVKRQALLDASLGRGAAIRPEDPLQQGFSELRACKRPSTLRSFSMYAPKQDVIPGTTDTNTPKLK
jgi:hypothetical protein